MNATDAQVRAHRWAAHLLHQAILSNDIDDFSPKGGTKADDRLIRKLIVGMANNHTAQANRLSRERGEA